MNDSGRRLTDAKAVELVARVEGDPSEAPCPYLPGRTARHVNMILDSVPRGLYQGLMDLNFRRLGTLFYRPQCDGCKECRMIRIKVLGFRPTRSQRRCWARNKKDVAVEVARPRPTIEKQLLYERYLESRHAGPMGGSTEEFEQFLYTSCVDSREITYRLAGRLLGVGLVDVEPQALSAVYCYFDPHESRRSPGVFNVLWMIEECRRRGLPYLYLGFFIRDCVKMNYKAGFTPCEILQPDGHWALFGESSTQAV